MRKHRTTTTTVGVLRNKSRHRFPKASPYAHLELTVKGGSQNALDPWKPLEGEAHPRRAALV